MAVKETFVCLHKSIRILKLRNKDKYNKLKLYMHMTSESYNIIVTTTTSTYKKSPHSSYSQR